jgi:hypothetical protein
MELLGNITTLEYLKREYLIWNLTTPVGAGLVALKLIVAVDGLWPTIPSKDSIQLLRVPAGKVTRVDQLSLSIERVKFNVC